MADTKENAIESDEIKILKTSDIAKSLNIGESTVRKYAIKLDEKGYRFRRDENNERIYTSRDQEALYNLVKLRTEKKVGLDVAAETVAAHSNQNYDFGTPSQSVQPSTNKDLAEFDIATALKEMRQDIQEEMKEIVAQEMQNTISRTQATYLMETMDKMLDSQAELFRKYEAATKENELLNNKLNQATNLLERVEKELQESNIHKKKSLIQRLFG